MTRRAVALLAAVVALVGLLSACQVKSGAAAFVGDQRIEESTVSSYLTGTAPTPSADGNAPSLTPRAQVVSTLISEQLFRRYLGSNGGVPSDAQLQSSRDTAWQTVTGQGAPEPDQFRTTLDGLGFDAGFAELFDTQIELEYQVIDRSKATSAAELSQAVTAVAGTPKVSPRYGSWNPETLTVDGATPDYLQLSTPSSTSGA